MIDKEKCDQHQGQLPRPAQPCTDIAVQQPQAVDRNAEEIILRQLTRCIQRRQQNQQRDKPLPGILPECGLNTLRHFHRVFKEVTGYCPGTLPSGYQLNLRSLAMPAEAFDLTTACDELPYAVLLKAGG